MKEIFGPDAREKLFSPNNSIMMYTLIKKFADEIGHLYSDLLNDGPSECQS